MPKKPTYEELEKRIQELEQSEPERKKAGAALGEIEEQYKLMFDNAPIGYQSLDKNGCILDVNKAWLDSLGYQRDEVIGVWFGEFLHHDQKDIFQKLFPVNIQSREPIHGVEFTLKRKDGSFIIAEYTARIGGDAEGRFVRTHCVLQDITERKQAEEALRKSEERYRMLFEKSPSSLWDEDFSDVKIYIEGLRDSGVEDMRGYFENHPEAVLRCAALVKVIGVNKATLELYHAGSLEEFQTGLGTILGEESHDVFREELIALADGETSFESEAITRTMKGDKTHIILRWSVLPGYEETLSKVLVSVMDITDRKQAEEELRESEEKYRNVYNLLRLMCDNVPDLIWSKDLEGRFLFVNQAMCDNLIMCDRPDKALGKTDMFFAEQQRNAGHEHTFGEKCIDSDAIIKEKRAPGRFLEDGLVSNKYLVLDVHKAPFLNKDGEMIGMVGCGRDVTKEKETEKALWKSEERYRSLVESSDDSIYLVAEDLTYLFMNRSHLSHYGGKTEKVIGRNYAEFHSENETRDFANRMRTIFDTGRPLSYEYQSEKNGGYYLRSLNPVKDSSGETKAVTVVSRNITERNRMEEELLRAQKLESVGLLAGGIAHDFNNILTIIMGNISLAKTDLAQGDDPSDLLTEAERASKRAQTLTKQLLTFAKGGAPVKETAFIQDILKESSSFVLRGSKSSCKLSIAEDLWPAEIDVGQISQVINNIVINANQAMPKGGTIQVAADNLIIEGRLGLPVKAGKYVRISIIDQGVGIAQNHLANIFDPYFTTKQEGSGLGLATSFSIIKKHDGHIAVESQLGVGTTFHIYLPASEKMVPEKEETRLIKGHGRILVMDDEASLRKMLGRMLKDLDYESEFAKDGAEALQMYKDAQESEKPYDAVILDLTIPGGMGGKEAIKKLLEIDPEVKAIVSSGYSDDPVLANFQEYGFKGMMPKPFEFRSLGKVLHEVLKGEKE